MSNIAPVFDSDDRRLSHFGEVTAQRAARVGGQLNEHAATVMGIGAAHEQSLADHRLQPAQSGGCRDCRGDAQARDRHAQVRDLRLEKVSSMSQAGSANRSSAK